MGCVLIMVCGRGCVLIGQAVQIRGACLRHVVVTGSFRRSSVWCEGDGEPGHIIERLTLPGLCRSERSEESAPSMMGRRLLATLGMTAAERLAASP